mmetsp:Transcript_7093/g.11445  ORF Transcript_7093/g.11445 Transcript_7093/m.11445 type:complete len:524 (+) Transcript_7093:70-1641(+)
MRRDWFEHVFTIKFSNLAGEQFEADFEETHVGWGRHARSWPSRVDNSLWIAQKDDLEGVIARHVAKMNPGRGVPCGCVTLVKSSTVRSDEYFTVDFEKVSKDFNKRIIRFVSVGTFSYVMSVDAIPSLTEERINGFRAAPRSFWDQLDMSVSGDLDSEKIVGSTAWQIKNLDTWMEILMFTAGCGACSKTRKDLKKVLPPQLFTKELIAEAHRRNLLPNICWFFADCDRDAVLFAASMCGKALSSIGNRRWCRDREIMMAAVSKDACALEYCLCDEGDRDIVSAALAQNGRALQFAGTLRNDREMVDTAMRQNTESFMYASKELRSHREFVLSAIARNGSLLRFAENSLRSDKQFVIEAMNQNGLALQGAIEKHKMNRSIVLAAVRQNGLALKFADRKRRKDRNIVLAAILQTKLAFELIDESLKTDAHLIQAAHGRTAVAVEPQQKRGLSDHVGPAIKRARLPRESSNSNTPLWTDAEVGALKQLHAKHGNKWKNICQQFDFRGKTPMQLKDKMRNLLEASH